MKKHIIRGIVGIFSVGVIASMALANEPYLPKQEKTFSRIDANKDGKIEWPEFATLAGRRMAPMDQNGDKIVSSAEIDAALQKQIERRRTRLLASFDKNKDGNVSQEELDKFAQAMFNGADADKDGALSLTEAQGFKVGPWRKIYLAATP